MQQNHSLLWYGSIKRTRASCPRTCRGKRLMWGSVITVAKAVVFYTHLLFHLMCLHEVGWRLNFLGFLLLSLRVAWLNFIWLASPSVPPERSQKQRIYSIAVSAKWQPVRHLHRGNAAFFPARTNLVSRQNTNKSVLTGMDSEGSPSQNEVWWCRAVVFLYCVSEQLLVLHIQYIHRYIFLFPFCL